MKSTIKKILREIINTSHPDIDPDKKQKIYKYFTGKTLVFEKRIPLKIQQVVISNHKLKPTNEEGLGNIIHFFIDEETFVKIRNEGMSRFNRQIHDLVRTYFKSYLINVQWHSIDDFKSNFGPFSGARWKQ